MGVNTNYINIEKDAPPNIKERARNALKQLNFLRDGSKVRWWFKSSSSTSYRRRKFPHYLLHPDCAVNPTFETHSNLPMAFSDLHSIELVIDLSNYSHVFCDENGNNIKGAPSTLTLQAGLVTGADEIIKNVLRHLFKTYKIKLVPLKQEHKFIFKISGFREYLMSSTPLLHYERVRAELRGSKSITIILSEIEHNLACTNFPPIIERDMNELKRGYISPLNWNQFYETPLILWYPPRELPILKASKDYIYNKNENKQDLNTLLNVQSIHRVLHTPDFIAKPIKENDSLPWFDQETSYSGDLDLPFTFRILGIENLSIIYEQEEEGATDNGFITPPYITKQPPEQEGEHAHVKKKKDKKEKLGDMAIPRLAKSKKELDYNLNVITPYHTNHGSMGGIFLALAKDQGLPFVPYTMSVEYSLYHGCNLLRPTCRCETNLMPFSFNPRWFQKLSFPNILYSNLPKEARLCFNLKVYSTSGASMIIASTSHTIFEFTGRMRDGVITLNLWPFYKTEPRFASMNDFWLVLGKNVPPNKEPELTQYRNAEYARLVIQVDTFDIPFYWKLKGSIEHENNKRGDSSNDFNSVKPLLKRTPTTEDLAQLHNLLDRDPLTWDLKEHEKETLIICRHHYRTIPEALPIFLTAIDWSDPKQVFEAHMMLKVWQPLDGEEAICLLDARFADSQVRLYAVERLSDLSNDVIALYLLELVQALVYETYHMCPLSEFLLERALSCPYQIGQQFFWLLRSQLNVKIAYERFALLLEQFVMLSGSFRQELIDEVTVNESIRSIAEDIPRLEKGLRLSVCRQKLAELKNSLPPEFSITLDPRMRATELVPEKCKIMDSKKLPLWIAAKNTQLDCKNILYIYKVGDDLRQDQLTIQLLKIMDKIWLENDLDLRMKPYRVSSTADQVGMIEVVLDSDTTSSIHNKFGGKLGALDKQTLLNYIEQHNKDEKALSEALENFIRSCAGYCVATYVLGIGDRHSGNIMVTQNGHLFHIDFGHFLGNFKKKLGFNRERTPFVFTEEMSYAMGGKKSEKFARFTEYCTSAYNLVRKKGHHFISLFILMLSAGMPELQEHDDINYLKEKLSLDLSEQQAINKFKQEIDNTLNSLYRRIDNLIHSMKRTG